MSLTRCADRVGTPFYGRNCKDSRRATTEGKEAETRATRIMGRVPR
jgi:hypothetical protein